MLVVRIFFFPIDQSQHSREGFLAGAAEELVVRHRCPQPERTYVPSLTASRYDRRLEFSVRMQQQGRSGTRQTFLQHDHRIATPSLSVAA